MRVSYYQVFQIVNGAVSPRVPVQIGGITMGTGVSFGRGVQFAGVDLAALAGHDLEVEFVGGTAVIKGHY